MTPRRFPTHLLTLGVFAVALLFPIAAHAVPLPPLGIRAFGAGWTYTVTDEPAAVIVNPGSLGLAPLGAAQVLGGYRYMDRWKLIDRLNDARDVVPFDPTLPGDGARMSALTTAVENLAREKTGIVSDLAFGITGSFKRFGGGILLRSYTYVTPVADLDNLTAETVNDNASSLKAVRLKLQEYSFGYAHPLSFLTGDTTLHTLHLALAAKVIAWDVSMRSVSVWSEDLNDVTLSDLLDLPGSGEAANGAEITIDAGILYTIGDILHLGLTARNITAPSFLLPDGEELEIEPQIRIGGNVTVASVVRVALDYDLTKCSLGLPGDGERNLSLGVEGAAFGLRLRGGLRRNTIGEGTTAFTVGAGFAFLAVTSDLGFLYSPDGKEIGVGANLRVTF